MKPTKEEKLGGAFFANLNRNNSKIRGDRAIAITEDAQLLFKRELEDMQMRLKRLRRERESMLDLSPTSADSLILASDFNAEKFVKKDISIGLDIRNLEIAIEIAQERYNVLFVEEGELLTENA
jgi:hypothetical protein